MTTNPNDSTTNADNIQLALTLANARKGTFSGLVIRKKGKTKGGKLYGDDLVHVTLYTGFRYESLVRRSLELLPEPGTDEFDDMCDRVVGYAKRRGVADKDGNPLDYSDVARAIEDLRASFQRTLDGTSTATTDHVFEPLVVDGETVRGARVYRCVAGSGRKCHCRECSGNKRAPKDGQINLSGLKVGQKVLEASANGHAPHPASRADVIAKRLVRGRLPISRYVSYVLEEGGDYVLRAGGAAAVAATKDGVTMDADEVREAAELLAG
jgi:hypothetical protein